MALSRSPRLVATDLDGTLLDRAGRVSERTRRVLAQLADQGVPTVVVTSRPLRWMDDVWDQVGGHTVGVVAGGAVVYDVPTRRPVRVRAIDATPGRALLGRLRADVPGVAIGVETLAGPVFEPTFRDPETLPSDVRSGPVDDLWGDAVLKLLVRHPDLADDVLRERVAAAVGDAAHATWSVPGLVEISAAGVTKAAALAEVAASLDVGAADVVAFGDMPNDLPMLTWAGTSYAMAGGHASVLAAADGVAPAHDDDGVARVLEQLFGLADAARASEVPA